MNTNKNSNLIIVCLLALAFFILSSVFIAINQSSGSYFLWSSPDESANYFFAVNYAVSGELSVFDPAGIVGSGWTVPRSLRSDFGFLKPVSFLGIILIFGSIASVLGVSIIPFLTPLFASLGIIIFYLLIRNLFKEKVALWSAFLLSFFPVYIYYSVRAMFHNVLFVVLLLSALYFLSLTLIKKRWLSFLPALLGGVFIGSAIITRTSELLWLLPLLFLLWLFYFRKFGFIRLLLFLVGVSIGILPMIYYNQILYGSFFSSGYNELNNSISTIYQVSSEFSSRFSVEYFKEGFEKIKNLIFYFGFKPIQSLKMFSSYLIKMFPLLFWPGLFGFILLSISNIYRPKKKIIAYILGGILISIFLVLYYGSWKFNDNPDLSRVTIGNSYTRYWLPIYLWLMPLASWFLIRFTDAVFTSQEIGKKLRLRLSLALQSFFVFIYILISIFFVLVGSEEGLIYWRYHNLADRRAAEIVLTNTEESSVIISRYNDKLLFPQRRVINASLPDDNLSPIINELLDYYPVYYYFFKLREQDLEYLNIRRLAQYGLKIEPVMMTSINTYLYQLQKIENLAE